MATSTEKSGQGEQSPFAVFDNFLQNLPLPEPPAWLVEESHRRMVLVINHVLMQEAVATERMTRQQGNVVMVQWRNFSFKVKITKAGLLDLADQAAKADLVLSVTENSPFTIAQALLRGDKPSVRIEGDVQLAADVNWLVDNVRWDVEEDMARAIGDVPAHTLAQAAKSMAAALQQFVRPKAGPTT